MEPTDGRTDRRIETNDATRQFLHRADLWLGVMQLLEFAFPCDETPLARKLAALPDAPPEVVDHVVSAPAVRRDGAGEERTVLALAAARRAEEAQRSQETMFGTFVARFWTPRGSSDGRPGVRNAATEPERPSEEPRGMLDDTTDSVVAALGTLDDTFGQQHIGEWPGQHAEEFKNAWFRVKLLTKAVVVDKWHAGGRV